MIAQATQHCHVVAGVLPTLAITFSLLTWEFFYSHVGVFFIIRAVFTMLAVQRPESVQMVKNLP